MEEQIEKIEVAAKKTWPVLMAWIGGITAVIGFIATISGGGTWLINHHRHNVEYKAKLALAQAQTGQQQYQAALATDTEMLKDDPLDRKVLDAQLDTAMLWVENFSVDVPEGKDEADLAGPPLDAVLPILTRGLSGAKQARLADVEAHLGWAHFLNSKMTQREDDSIAQKDWQDALTQDPTNVYANAMLGNWMLQTYGDFNEAMEHLHIAVRTGRARPFVRQLEVGGLLDLDEPGARPELIRVANEMRKGGEELDPTARHNITNMCCSSPFPSHKELIAALEAVPNDEAWQTYLWLRAGFDSESRGGEDLDREFIHANLLELAGRRDAALDEYRQLAQALKDNPGLLQSEVGAAIERLSGA